MSEKRKICVQLQLDRLHSPVGVKTLIEELSHLPLGPATIDEADCGTYANVVFQPPDLVNAWHNLREFILDRDALSKASIVTCQGDQGWDDYLLLHHYDDEEKCDSL